MDCPACQSSIPPDHKFCGACGHRLESTCAQCGAQNPPAHKFCGQCGADLTMAGAITLSRSGLITRVDQETLDLLGYHDSDMEGRPFSLFVERDNLVIFFSHWNELLNHGKTQRFEIALKDKGTKSVYAMLECTACDPSSEESDEMMISIKEVTEDRLKADLMQHKQDLLSLVFSLTDSINTVSERHLDRAIEDALKKICLFSKSDRCFIYSINRQRKRIEQAYQWRQPASEETGEVPKPESVPFSMIRRAVGKLREERTYVINDVSKLAPSQRYELTAWHHTDLSALVCHLLYSKKRPIGIIGLAKHTSEDEWDKDCVALVNFFGQLVSNRLPFANLKDFVVYKHHERDDHRISKKKPESESTDNPISINEIHSKDLDKANEIPVDEEQQKQTASQQALVDASPRMSFEKLAGRKATDQQSVFPRDDGLILLTCPSCGIQESVSVDQFNRLGNAIRVTCSCDKLFSAVLEKRQSVRKAVNLDGYYTLKEDLDSSDDKKNIWGPMVVRDLSKAGLRFSAERADLVHPGDLLMVRFNLDNPNHSLIQKPARVVTTTHYDVGCRFEGADSYDITLGFYFI